MLTATAGATVAIAAAACSKAGSGSATPTPTATGSPTPVGPNSCQIVWVSTDGSSALLDELVIDAPVQDWVSGPVSFDVNAPVAVFYHDLNSAQEARAAAEATAGQFVLEMSGGTGTGGQIAFSDTTDLLSFFALNLTSSALLGAHAGSGGMGTFSGVWGPPGTTTPVPGQGTLSIAWDNTNFTLGQLGSYARCYSVGGMAPPGGGL